MNSDVMIIKPTALDGTAATLSYTITWSWTYSGNQPSSSTRLYLIDKIEMTLTSAMSNYNCDTSTKVCTFAVTSQAGTAAYVITTNSVACNSSTRYYSRCRLGWCTC